MGDPSDPIKNCLLEVCCVAAEAEALFAQQLVDDGVCKEDVAKAVAAHTFKRYELATRGTLTAFKADISRVAKA